MRRSSLVAAGVGAVAVGLRPRAVPQAMQKRAPAGAAVPQDGQLAVRGVPQAMQKAAPSGLEAWQLGQAAAVCAMFSKDHCANRGRSHIHANSDNSGGPGG